MSEEFGRYTLLRRLAVGGMAEIFLAAMHGDSGFEKRVVVKRILPHLNADGDFVKMFIDEAVLAARLEHPNIVQVFDFGSMGTAHYIAMEFIEGVDLHRLLRELKNNRRLLTAAEVAALGEGVARGLSYTHNLTDDEGHNRGIVHRDVSPHNLMLSVTGDPKVMDFGIAKAAARFSRTATGTIKGKLAYMAPEQAMGGNADKRSDQFSLGVVLWECLSGRRLFQSDTEVSLMQNVLACDIPTLRSVRPSVPESLEAIVMRALRKDPSERFEDLAEMAQQLTAFRYALGPEGMADLGALARTFGEPPQGEGPKNDWSWAEVPTLAPGGTRPIAARKTTDPKPVDQARTTDPSGEDPTGKTRMRVMSPNTAEVPAPKTRPPTLDTDAQSPRVTPQYRTTWRIDRMPTHKVPVKRRVALGGVLLMALGLGLPLALWSNARKSVGSALGSWRQPAANTRPLADLGDGATGRLTLTTDGAALVVYLGTERLGTTPINEAEVPAGRLELRLVNETAGTWRRYEIFVPEGGRAQGLVSSQLP